MIRAFLADDEDMARARLRHLLSAFEDIQIVGEAVDGVQAMELIAELRPDLVFLDIQMPGCSGTEVAQSLSAPRPRIVFCTAYEQYALEAFELCAVDYLLKPVNRLRLSQAIQRVRDLTPEESESRLNQISQASRGRTTRFLARRGSKYRVIPQSEVLCFASDEGLTKLCTAEHEYWVDPTLNDLEVRLDPRCFCRISRSSIVNLDQVREVAPLAGGLGQAILKNNLRVEISRRRFKDFLAALESAE
jgi:two-component system LytT family response regulator